MTVFWAQNGTTSSRSGTATIAANVFSVTQGAAPPPTCTSFSISPTSVNPDYQAGSQVVTITGSPAGCTGGSWTAAANGSWLTVSPESGSGSDWVTVSWAQNASTSPRTDTAVIAETTFAVTQANGGDLIFRDGFENPASACVSPACQNDTVCNFNDGSFCGTPIGDVQICQGVCGTGLCSNGQGRVILGNSPAFSQESFEVEARVSFTHLPGPSEYGSAIASKYVNHFPGLSEWWLGVTGNGSRQWVLLGDGTSGIFSPPGTVDEGVPYHVRGVWDGSHGEIWVNETLVASGTISRNPGPTSTAAIIAGAASGDTTSPFYGMIDEVRIGCLRP